MSGHFNPVRGRGQLPSSIRDGITVDSTCGASDLALRVLRQDVTVRFGCY